MKSMKRKIILVFLIFFLIGATFAGGFYFGKSKCKICPPEEIDFSLFWEAYHKLQEKFIEKEIKDIEKELE